MKSILCFVFLFLAILFQAANLLGSSVTLDGDNLLNEKEFSETNEAIQLLREVTNKKRSINKEVTCFFYSKAGNNWLRKTYKYRNKDGGFFHRIEEYLIRSDGEKLTRVNIHNNQGYWEIFGGFLLRLDFRNASLLSRREEVADKRNVFLGKLDEGNVGYRYYVEDDVLYNGYLCHKITKLLNDGLVSNSLGGVSEDELNNDLLICDQNTKIVYFIDENNYMVGMEIYDDRGMLVSDRRIDDYDINPSWGVDRFDIVDMDRYINVELDTPIELRRFYSLLAKKNK